MLRGLSRAFVPTKSFASKAVFSRAMSSKGRKTGDETAVFEFGRPFKTFDCEAPPNELETSKTELLELFEQMAYYRRFEIVCDTLYKARQIRGFCHLYDGQEAVLCGMERVIKKTDSLITSYRDHCHQLSRGDTGESVMSELLGKETGCSRGKGGSMHMYYPENNFYGGNGIVGAQVPLGVGQAFAHKYRGDGGVSVSMYGDGAANQGQIFEVFNMAAMWKLPAIFVCENNEYAMGTSTSRHAASHEFYKRAGYIPGLWVDGMDVLASKAAFQFATDHCRSGKGPIIVEMSTYRYHGHSMSDPGISYRSREEVDTVRRERDCIDAVKNRLLDQNWATPAEIKAIEKKIRVKVDKHVTFAQNAKDLPVSQLFEDIYHTGKPPHVRHVDHANSHYGENVGKWYTA